MRQIILLLLIPLLVHCLYKDEVFLYNGVAMKLSDSFNITLVQVGTIPMSLKQNSLCQVPDFQLQKFNNDTNYRFSTTSKKRDNTVQCDTVKYCDNDGLAGSYDVCPGTQHHLVDGSCIEKLFSSVQSMTKEATTAAVTAAKEFTESAISSAISGVTTSFHQALDGVNSALTSTIKGVEEATFKAISESTAQVTAAMKTNIDNLAAETSATIKELKDTTETQLQLASNQINTLNTDLRKSTQLLEMAIRQTTIATSNRIQDLSDYISKLADSVNYNSFNMQTNLDTIMKSMQQITIQVEKQSRFELQGVDISSLLAEWGELDNSTIFQDFNTQTYKYVKEGFVSIYDKNMPDVDYPPEHDVEEKVAYQCHESGPDTVNPRTMSRSLNVTVLIQNIDTTTNNCLNGSFTNLNVGNVNTKRSLSTTLAEGLPKYLIDLLGILCPSRASEFIDDLTSNIWDEVEIIFCYSPSNIYDDMSRCRYASELYGDGSKFPLSISLRNRNGLNKYLVVSAEFTSPSNTNERRAIGSCIYAGRPTGALPTPKSTYVDSITRPDSGRYFYFTASPNHVLSSVTPDYDVYNTVEDSSLEGLVALSKNNLTCNGGLRSATYNYQITVMKSSYNGENQFLFSHPQLGIMQIHRCTKLGSANNFITEFNYTTYPYAITNATGHVQRGGSTARLPGKITVSSYGLSNGNVAITELPMIVPQTSVLGPVDYIMQPNSYYYTRDIWCCNSVQDPVMTVSAESDCSALKYNVCPNTMYGSCTSGSRVDIKRLVKSLSGVFTCPAGYNVAASNFHVRYKSPRMYFCSSKRKYSEPYGVELTYCTTSEITLPGKGVSVITGTMSPSGLYPAACIYWTDVKGVVPLYTITAEFENQVVPVMLNNLHGKKVAYYYGAGIAVDEMDRLYGIGNSGYDCVTYEMDKMLHEPKNCINYAIPQYDIVAYFSSRVRTSGLSRLLDYFDITPIRGSSSSLIMNFKLKAGIDYESALVDNINSCPSLQVNYQSNPPKCVLSGWPTQVATNVAIEVAGINVCNQGACSSQLVVNDGASIKVDVIEGTSRTTCNLFQCYASTNTFIAYPVDTFQIMLQRPNVNSFIPGLANYNYTDNINNILGDLSEGINYLLRNWTSSNLTLGNFDASISINFTAPNIDTALANFQYNMDNTLKNATSILEQTKANIDATMAEAKQAILDELNKQYGSALQQIKEIIDKYNLNVETGEDGSSTSGGFASAFDQASDLAISGTVVGFVALGIAATSLIMVIIMCCKK